MRNQSKTFKQVGWAVPTIQKEFLKGGLLWLSD